MPRKKPGGVRKRRAPEVDPGVMAYLADDPDWEEKKGEDHNPFVMLNVRYPRVHGRSWETYTDQWLGCREHVLRQWIPENPGTRPRAWWKVEAPRLPEEEYPENFRRPTHKLHGLPFLYHLRERLGGSGELSGDRYPTKTEYGIPLSWDEETLDPEDLPLYESQAAYLDRFDLLTEREREQLGPEDFEPVRVNPIELKVPA